MYNFLCALLLYRCYANYEGSVDKSIVQTSIISYFQLPEILLNFFSVGTMFFNRNAVFGCHLMYLW